MMKAILNRRRRCRLMSVALALLCSTLTLGTTLGLFAAQQAMA